MTLVSRLRCAGCLWVAPREEPYPFQCENAKRDDDVDHVLRRALEIDDDGAQALACFDDDRPQPFLRYRPLLHTWLTAATWGVAESDWTSLVEELDDALRRVAVGKVEGAGFRESPLRTAGALAGSLGIAELWIKDETGNVAGSHKARHLMGLALWLAIAERNLRQRRERGGSRAGDPLTGRLAIASCGNAALAAAVVARAAGRSLDVYVPPHADPAVLSELDRLGSYIHTCERRPGERGDPSYLRFREALRRGAVPFSCQGNVNGLVIEGGQTLVWEMISALRRTGDSVDRLCVQVGGGALATACLRGWSEATQLGATDRVPIVHAVQTESAHPLARAWDTLARELAKETGAARPLPAGERPSTAERASLARALAARLSSDEISQAVAAAACRRTRYMRPWESEPRSLATGILDDETYDWLAVVEGMLRTGGFPVVVSEQRLAEAHRQGQEATGIAVDPTGSAGLAGLIELSQAGVTGSGERAAVLFTGIER